MKARDFYKKLYVGVDISEYSRDFNQRNIIFKQRIGGYCKLAGALFPMEVKLNHRLYYMVLIKPNGIVLLVKNTGLYVTISTDGYKLTSGNNDILDFALSIGKEIDDMDEDEINMIRMYAELVT